MQIGDLVKYDSVAKNWLCYGIIKEFKTVDSKEKEKKRRKDEFMAKHLASPYGTMPEDEM